MARLPRRLGGLLAMTGRGAAGKEKQTADSSVCLTCSVHQEEQAMQLTMLFLYSIYKVDTIT